MSLTQQTGNTGQDHYITAVIQGVYQDIALGADGNNNSLFKGVVRLAGLIPLGLMDSQALTEFALAATPLSRNEAIATINSAIRKGQTSPLDLSKINTGQFTRATPTRQARRQQKRLEAKNKEADKKEQQRIEQGQRWSVSLWDKASIIPDDISYLTVTRGLGGFDFAGNIRFLSTLKCKQDNKPDSYWPALIMAARPAPTAIIKSCFRLYLSHDGKKKAPVLKAKLAAASYKGLGHWVGNDASDTLIIVEGVENAYALHKMRPDNPLICAAFSSGNIPNITPPDGIRTVILSGDNDAAGQEANAKAAHKLALHGYEVKTLIPPYGMDWNDILLQGGFA